MDTAKRPAGKDGPSATKFFEVQTDGGKAITVGTEEATACCPRGGVMAGRLIRTVVTI